MVKRVTLIMFVAFGFCHNASMPVGDIVILNSTPKEIKVSIERHNCDTIKGGSIMAGGTTTMGTGVCAVQRIVVLSDSNHLFYPVDWLKIADGYYEVTNTKIVKLDSSKDAQKITAIKNAEKSSPRKKTHIDWAYEIIGLTKKDLADKTKVTTTLLVKWHPDKTIGSAGSGIFEKTIQKYPSISTFDPTEQKKILKEAYRIVKQAYQTLYL